MSFFMALLVNFPAHTQYYYQHMVSAALGAERFNLLKEANVKEVSAISFSAENERDTSFQLLQEVDLPKNQLRLFTRSAYNSPGYMTSQYDEKGRITGVYDSSGSIVNISTYRYDPTGLLTELYSSSSDTVQSFSITEKFLIRFNDHRNPVEMVRIKNNTDTTVIKLIPSENGKPGEEQWWKNGRKTATYYYYYNAEGYLTDVASFNPIAKRVLPMITFEYNDYGEMTKKTVVPISSNNYRVWKMEYDESSLLTSEKAYDKHGQLEGSIYYTYR